MQLFRFQKGYSPVFISNARSGTLILPEIAAKMTDQGLAKPETDWHLSRVLDLPAFESAAMMTANLSLYVADLLADPNSSEIIPLMTADGDAIYLTGQEPGPAEVAKRREHYFAPYHDQLSSEVTRLKEKFPVVVLMDAHSVAAEKEAAHEIEFRLNATDTCPKIGSLASRLEALAERYEGVGVSKAGELRRIASQFSEDAAVCAIEIHVDQSSYLDADDGTMDFQLTRDLTNRLEPIMVAVMEWAEEQK